MIGELNERIGWWIARSLYLNITDPSKLVEKIVELTVFNIHGQITNIDARHLLRKDNA